MYRNISLSSDTLRWHAFKDHTSDLYCGGEPFHVKYSTPTFMLEIHFTLPKESTDIAANMFQVEQERIVPE